MFTYLCNHVFSQRETHYLKLGNMTYVLFFLGGSQANARFNCSCVGISRCLAAYCKDDTPTAGWDDITEEDKAEAKRYGDLMGEKALGILSKK